MSDIRTRPWGICNPRQANVPIGWRKRFVWLARRFIVALLAIFIVSTAAAARPQPQPAPQQPSQPQATPKCILTPTVTEAGREATARDRRAEGHHHERPEISQRPA